MKHLALTLTVSLSGLAAQADILNLTYDKDAKQINSVQLASSATLNIDGRNTALTEQSAGLRRKKVTIFWADVYVAQLFTATAMDTNCDKKTKLPIDDTGLNSLKNQKAVALRMDFVRSLSKEQIDTAFRDSFDANKIDAADAGVKAFLDAVAAEGDADNATTLMIVGEPGKDSDTVTLQDVHGKITPVTGTGLVTKVFSIWLGTPVAKDEGLANLKNALACPN